jgi:hypothetical protein
MSHNVSNNHPIINNSNQYFYEKKYISISSEDRDISKYPNSSEFEIFFPQEYLNVVSARLYSWSFPANYNVFSALQFNVTMSFKFETSETLYNPGAVGISDPLLEGIFAALYANIDEEYVIMIEPGFYNPEQMRTELTNKFNEVVTNYITNFFNEHVTKYPVAKSLFRQYNRFNIVYNSVSQKLWFGNTTDKFILTNDSTIFFKRANPDSSCIRSRILPDYSSWGLPGYLGFTKCPTTSLSVNETLLDSKTPNIPDSAISPNLGVPRFYYGEAVPGSGDNGYWLLPGAPGATVYFLQAPFKISFMGPSYIYMEVDGMNCIDETSPWDLSQYTAHTNQTNGIVNSSFAKIPVPTTPISQWFDTDMGPYKYWNPPAERISKFKFKFRYHNGQLVDFGAFTYSFMLEFNLLRPQQERSYSIRNASDLGQIQGFNSKFI